jgi:hypothetical protein
MAARIFTHLLGKEFINLMQSLAVKVSLPVPSRRRNALGIEDERKIFLGSGKQAGHAIAARSLQGPGSRFRVLVGGSAPFSSRPSLLAFLFPGKSSLTQTAPRRRRRAEVKQRRVRVTMSWAELAL